MRLDKDLAVNLRKEGKSYNQISKALKVSKSTLNYWFKNQNWSEELKQKLVKRAKKIAKRNMRMISLKAKANRLKLYAKMRVTAAFLYKKFHNEPLFREGLMAYWGEGDNKLENGQIRVTNSNPLLVKSFYMFIKRYLSQIAPKVKMYLVLYPDLNDDKCKKYWSKILGLSLDRFFKSQYIKGRSAKRTVRVGMGTLVITSRSFKELLMHWLSLRKKEISLTRV